MVVEKNKPSEKDILDFTKFKIDWLASMRNQLKNPTKEKSPFG